MEKKIVTANEFQLVDSENKVRATLSNDDLGTSLSFYNSKGNIQLRMMLDKEGLAFLKMYNDKEEAEKIDISVDSKGTHLLLAGKGKQQSYLFLKNDGSTGVVLKDQEGNRKAQVLLDNTGKPDVSIYPIGNTEITLK